MPPPCRPTFVIPGRSRSEAEAQTRDPCLNDNGRAGRWARGAVCTAAHLATVPAWILGSSPRMTKGGSAPYRRRSHSCALPSRPPKQLVPVRVRLPDQLDLPLPRPALQRLLTLDGVADVEMLLVPDEALYAVAGGEARARPLLVLGKAPAERVGDADIDRAKRRRRPWDPCLNDNDPARRRAKDARSEPSRTSHPFRHGSSDQA